MFNHRYAEISVPWSMLRQTRALIREKVQRSLGSSLDIIGILFLFGSDEKRREREWLRSIHSGCVSFIYHFSYVLHYYILTYNLLEKLYQNYYLDTYHTYPINNYDLSEYLSEKMSRIFVSVCPHMSRIFVSVCPHMSRNIL